MHNTAKIDSQGLVQPAQEGDEDCEIIELRPGNTGHDSLFVNFVDEIDAWARQALAANGFGDY